MKIDKTPTQPRTKMTMGVWIKREKDLLSHIDHLEALLRRAVRLLEEVFNRSEVNSNGRWLTYLTQEEWNEIGNQFLDGKGE